MRRRITIATLTLTAFVIPAAAQNQTRRATMVGGGGGSQGKCTIEVEVDGVADVSVSGDTGRIRTLSGQPATWRRFECTGQLPRNPTDFRFRGIDGRGNVNLVSDPRNSGLATVRIEDPSGGREGYTFDLEWSGGSSYGNDRFGRDDRFGRGDRLGRDRRYERNDRLGDDPLGSSSNAVTTREALRSCREAIMNRISQDGYTRVNILSADADNGPGRNDYIIGRATARNRSSSSVVEFDFSCNMNFNNGRVRSVDLRLR
jgi:hypothetical protein